jgi:hypothetical protein
VDHLQDFKYPPFRALFFGIFFEFGIAALFARYLAARI